MLAQGHISLSPQSSPERTYTATVGLVGINIVEPLENA